MNILLVIISLVLATLRIYGATTIFYQAIVHLFVGGLFGAAAISSRSRKFYLVLSILLTAVEAYFAIKGLL